MKVCFCTPQPPNPPVSGGRVETFRLVEGLAASGHEVVVVTYDVDADRTSGLEADADCTVRAVPDARTWGVTPYFRNLATSDPLPITQTRTAAFEEVVERVIGEVDPDVLHLHTLQTSYLARNGYDVPTVVRFTNAKSEIYSQFAAREANPAKSLYARYQAHKTRRYEGSITAAADVTLAITDADRERFLSYGAEKVATLPAGIDVERFRVAAEGARAGKEPVLTFFGSMDYHPNADAARWLATEIFPPIRTEHPSARLELVGKDPPEEVRELDGMDGVRVTGFIEDIYERIAQATVVVVPIRVGTGVRIKILHALAMGKPVVSTPTEMEGIPVEDGTHALVRAGRDEFAEAVLALFDDPDRRAALSAAGRSFVEERYDQDVVTGQLEEIYEMVRDSSSKQSTIQSVL